MRYYLWVLLLLSHREKAAWENPPFRLGWLLSLRRAANAFYFDRVILDSPAGVGRGFRAAAAAADCALIVCNSDPVCIRDASIVRRLLTELEVPQQRLVINRFNAEYFGSLSAGREDAGGLRDLDDVIDQSGVRLIGIVPEDRQMTAAFQRGCVPADDLPGMTALSRIAARMNGVSVPLSL